MKTRSKAFWAFVLTGALAAAAPAVAGSGSTVGQFVFTDLGSPGCCSAPLTGLNDHGRAIGWVDSTDGGNDPSFVAAGSMGKFREIGVSVAFFENGNLTNNGLTVGTSQISGNAYILNVNTKKLTLLPNISPYSIGPTGINASGTVVGNAVNSSGSVAHGYMYSGGNATLFDPPGSLLTTATVVNSYGEIGGSYQATKNTQSLFLYAGGKFTEYAVPGAVELLFPYAIDSKGNLAGEYADSAGKKHGVLVMNGTVKVIDYPGAKETSLNGFGPGGELVGYSVDNNIDSTTHGLIYRDGKFTRVDDPEQSQFGTFLTTVNASGMLAGDWSDGNGFDHPFTAVCPAAQAPCTN